MSTALLEEPRTESAAAATVVRGADQPTLWMFRDFIRPLLDGRQTGGRVGMAWVQLHPGDGPPPHVHQREDEAFHVLDGQVTFLFGDRMVVADAGAFVWAPRGIIHRFQCTSATTATMVLTVAPAALMAFFAEMVVPADDFANPPTLGPAIFDKLMRVAPQYGIEMRPDHVLPTTVVPALGPSQDLWVMGERVGILATAAQTGGQFTVVDIRSAPGGGPPPHVHTDSDEVWYVVDGRHEVRIGERTEVVGPGDVVFTPRGTRHTYTNVGDRPGRIVSYHTPGGFDAFYAECGVDATNRPVAPAAVPPPQHVLLELLARHGMTA